MGMEVVQAGPGGQSASFVAVDKTYSAGRSTLRPADWQNTDGSTQGGHFGLGIQTGLTTVIAAGGILLSFRWTDSARVCALNKINVSAVMTTGFGAAQAIDVDAVVVRGFTASDTGQTAVSMSSNSGKKRSTMSSSLVGDLRVANTAAIGTGTGTADTNPFAAVVIPTNLATSSVGASGYAPLFQVQPGTESPVVLQQNEGFRIRVVTVQGATGVLRYTFSLDWVETPAY